jgi:hypothetical protein
MGRRPKRDHRDFSRRTQKQTATGIKARTQGESSDFNWAARIRWQ